MRRFLPCVLMTAIATSTLAGCGAAGTAAPGSLRPDGVLAARADERAKAQDLSDDFFEMMRERYNGSVTQKGAVVYLQPNKEAAPTAYDFSAVPSRGQVILRSQDFTAEVSHRKLIAAEESTAEVLPVLLVPIAIEIALGGAAGFASYYLSHTGDFNKEQAIKAAVVGMMTAAVPFVGQIKYAQLLLPIAATILARSKSFYYKDLAQAALGSLDLIIELLRQMNKART